MVAILLAAAALIALAVLIVRGIGDADRDHRDHN